jgi:uncharacterized protein YgfB (UPF0149 family)
MSKHEMTSTQIESRNDQHKEMQAKLESLGIPFELVKVFGKIGTHVHILCKGANTSHKWAHVLAKLSDEVPGITKTMWEAKQNKGTTLRPTMIKGFMVRVSL